MTRRTTFDDLDKRALLALNPDFLISADNELATAVGKLEVEIVRVGDQFWLRFDFPGNELLVKILRTQLLEQLNIGEESRLF